MSVFLNAPALPFSARQWDRLIRGMLGVLGAASVQVNLYLERDRRLAELNREFMACPGPTNVLSFPCEQPNVPGEICIGYDTLQREARLYGQSSARQAVFLLAHGLAHILGHDHGQEMDEICALMIKSAPELELL